MPDSSSAMYPKGKTFVFEHMQLSCTQGKKDHLLKKPAEAKPDDLDLYAYSDKIYIDF